MSVPSVSAPAAGRSIELVLLAFAAVLTTGALVLVEANQEQELTRTLLYLGLAYLGLLTVAHLVVRKLAPHADPLILPCAALLNGLGLVMIHRVDLARADRATQLGTGAPQLFAGRQVAWTAIAILLFIGVLWFVKDHRVLSRYGYTMGFAGLVLIMLPGVLPASISEVNGAKIWLRLSIFSIQPGEFAKVLLMVFFSALLISKRELFTTAGRNFLGMELPRPRDLGPLLAAWLISVGVLALEKDLGSSLLYFGILLVLLYAATERVSWLVIGLAASGLAAFLGYQLFGHVRSRIEVWLDPFADFDGAGYQLGQALFGLGTGGVGGTGLGAGRPELVPLAWSDFIVSSIGEELGLIGMAAMLVIYLVLVTRGLRSALAVRDSFGKLLATGLSFGLALQVFLVIGGVTRLIPLTGLTVPFLSAGGSALVANYAIVALLLRISNAARNPASARPATPKPPLAQANTELVDNT
ncbi:FtsW/RodA/SpoVE family cell cycle protein [Pseudonocardia eucalypti]|uniref:peptidoglycan glycosyltransferase n=1 Tax=Pseudonocardia eucalypti TaxID=648755 RepID=A0ABP9PC43_9PSEU|nr:cell division protein FtsW (lipid II flippase) [Pseudonocardia eucalypti]